ncbi:MAG: hypothetical protein A2Y33_04240 [Spirochaetes bacterium GWF1_51_8]|nr:MAG: hypothetical protein A2Y33_04240 [Spirochaetes bacterium GWF1_51_8]
MSSILLETKTVTFGDLLGNSKVYKVPPFQRDYSWREENWEELWWDISNLEKEESVHYLGSVVLQKNNEKEYIIIDGQQRITSLSLLVISIIQCFQDLMNQGVEKENNAERKDLIINKFIGTKDPASLTYIKKLELNKNNNDFYTAYLSELREPPNHSRLNDSEKLLHKAKQYFYNELNKTKIPKSGETLAEFVNSIAERLYFIQISVEDELKAYTVFETLNARGLQLTSTDLLKNYLFSFGKTKPDMDIIQIRWSRIIDLIGMNDFPTFLRYFLNSKGDLIRKERLFKEIKKSVNSTESTLNLLESLEINGDIYKALKTDSDEFWNEKQRYKKYIREFNLFKVTQHIPILLSAFHKFNESEFVVLLKILSVIAFRYNIIGGMNPNDQEYIYNKVAVKIFQNEIRNAKSAWSELKPLYTSDEKFKIDFSNKTISTKSAKKLVRYILFLIENQIGNKNYDWDATPATIEHILPENYNAEWEKHFKEPESFLYRLGNYSLLEEKLNNRDASNKEFEEKRKVYEKSNYMLTSKLTQDFRLWNPDMLKKHQEEMARIASSIWRIDI